MRWRIAALAGLALAAVAGGWWWEHRPPTPTVWAGYAEADYVDLAPTLSGRLVVVAVARGALVAAGSVLFTQDNADDAAALAGARAQLAQAEANLANLRRPSRATEIDQAAASLAEQRAARDRAASDLARDLQLVGRSVVSRQVVDRERADLAAAQARVAGARANLAQMRAPLGRPEAIAAQAAAVAAARAAVAQAAWRLAQRRVVAPVGGIVADTYARSGEVVSAGAPVVELLPPANIRVRFFVAEADLGAVHFGQRVAITCDGCGGGLTGEVSFIAPQPEYTPPVIYSAESRARLVYLIEARPPAAEALRLKPGEPVEVRPLAGATAP